jgi:DNA-binding response OmpR family regulator
MHKVMLVEDDRTMASLLRVLFEMEGYQVFVWEGNNGTTSEEEILRDIQGVRPDLLLLDAHVYNIEGLNLLRQLRQNPQQKDIHILVTSGLDLSRECHEANADDFLLKPYMPDELIGLVHQILKDEVHDP